MDIPLETINSSPSCHFNFFCFTALQRLKGCQWNSSEYNSAFWEGRRGCSFSRLLPPKLRSMWLDREDMFSLCCSRNVPTPSCETGDSLLTGEACFPPEKHCDTSCWRCDQPYVVQLVSGAGNLHPPSPCCLEPCLFALKKKIYAYIFFTLQTFWMWYWAGVYSLISTSFKFLSSPRLAESN